MIIKIIAITQPDLCLGHPSSDLYSILRRKIANKQSEIVLVNESVASVTLTFPLKFLTCQKFAVRKKVSRIFCQVCCLYRCL